MRPGAAMTELARLMTRLRASRGFAHKRDIATVLPRLPAAAGHHGPNGDDCAVLPEAQGSGHLLLAIEGLVQDFVEARPWFAGYSAVMVNLSDVAAMGGRATAVVDALWSSRDDRAADMHGRHAQPPANATACRWWAATATCAAAASNWPWRCWAGRSG